MEFKSLQDLIRIVENALAVQFFGQSSVLRKGVLKVLAHVVGGALYMVVLIAKRIWKNRFVTTCDDDCLDGFGAEYGLPHKVPTYATGYVVVTPSVMSATIPQDTVFVDSSSKLEYRVTETTDVQSPLASSSNQLVPVIAVEVGYDYNMEAGVPLDFRDTPVADIASVESGVISGGVAEAVEIDGVVQVWGETADGFVDGGREPDFGPDFSRRQLAGVFGRFACDVGRDNWFYNSRSCINGIEGCLGYSYRSRCWHCRVDCDWNYIVGNRYQVGC